MARVPVIDSPCPLANRPLPRGASDHCSICDRNVHNLDLMNEPARREFMRSCSGKVCVAYTVRLPIRYRGFAVASLAAAALVALPAAADSPLAEDVEPPVGAKSPVPGAAPQFPNCDSMYDVVVTGGVSHGDQAEWADDGKNAPPELPTIEDDGR